MTWVQSLSSKWYSDRLSSDLHKHANVQPTPMHTREIKQVINLDKYNATKTLIVEWPGLFHHRRKVKSILLVSLSESSDVCRKEHIKLCSQKGRVPVIRSLQLGSRCITLWILLTFPLAGVKYRAHLEGHLFSIPVCFLFSFFYSILLWRTLSGSHGRKFW